ncbi:trihelix transcription factor ASR3 [Senna tora]|uniref:Trihelix transcription factor ASR3 n=1 Tax=Senna tora TaxID=362788 RepID=A0A834WRV0_9FABA|nr:trihelix transcription factor ASR3 [Senna tora]
MKDHKNGNESLSASRRTRSQVAPDWTVTESLILINEIAAVEADCSRALSSYQQWKIIAENCAVLDVGRGLNQCRRKWDSLLADYNKIKAWESKSTGKSYWSLASESAQNLGLPESFDKELFKAIGDLVKARDERSGTDPETETEVLDVTIEMGTKRKRRQVKSQRYNAEKPKNCRPDESLEELSKEMAQKDCVVERPEECQKSEEKDLKEDHSKDSAEEKTDMEYTEEKPPKDDLGMSVKSLVEAKLHDENLKESATEANVESRTIGKEENDEALIRKLQELAEQVQAIGTETADHQEAGSQNVEEFRTKFIRRQGDKLIASLGDFANTLNQLCNFLQECK